MSDSGNKGDICSEKNELILIIKREGKSDPNLISRLYEIGLCFENGDGVEQSDE